MGNMFCGYACIVHAMRGEFGTLRGWLGENLYRHGRKFKPDEILQRATGEAISIEPYMVYLRGKYGELYRLQQT